MIPKFNAKATSPPRLKGECDSNDFPPKLTPSSSVGSSTISSPGQKGTIGVTRQGHARSTRTKEIASKDAHNSSARRRRPNDASILRGAAVVRENLLSKLSGADCNMISSKKSLDSDEWSDPWDEKRQEALRTDIEEQQGTRQSDSAESSHLDGSFPTENEGIHWATMATMPKDEESFYSNQTPHAGMCLNSFPVNFSCHQSLQNLPSLFDSSDLSVARSRVDSEQVQPYNASPFDSIHDSGNILPPRQASLAGSEDGTHVTSMGRGMNLRMKIVTYNVQRLYESGDEGTYDESFESLFEDDLIAPETDVEPRTHNSIQEDHIIHEMISKGSRSSQNFLPIVPEAAEISPVTNANGSSAIQNPVNSMAPKITKYPGKRSLSSPLSKEYALLEQDEGFLHAQQAGYLWQSLLAHHVRFPKQWFEGLRAPPMGSDSPWRYVARLAVHHNPFLNRLVKNRNAPGRLLLHFVVRDLMTGMDVFDLAIGCFHPNAKGVRTTKRPESKDETCRHVWMSIRKVTGAVSILDHILCGGRSIDAVARGSPLGNSRRDVTNVNMRSVFGESPPIQTICIQESELYQTLASVSEQDPRLAKAPALLLLKEFLVLG